MKKLAATIFAALVVAGAATVTMAAEDFGPGENPNIQGAQPRTMLPETEGYIPSPDAPVLSVEDYQEINDAMGEMTENDILVPAFGDMGLTASTLPEEAGGEDNVAAAAVPSAAVPIAENEAIAPVNNADDAAGADTPNPDTGAADVLAPMITAILSLAAAPIVINRKK